MDVGVVLLPTDRSARPVELARAVEERGLESLFVGEHTHIPSVRATPFPLGGPLPDEYTRTLDPFVALRAVATATERIRFGTCISLLAQRDPIVTAKAIATLDLLSGGRMEVGIGYGWNREEAENHGIEWGTRRNRLREHVLAMRALWCDDRASFAGEVVSFDDVWLWPKPVQQPGPPVIVGAGPGPKTFAAIVDWADGWFPVPFFGHTPADVVRLRAVAEDGGRDPATITIHVDGVLPEAAHAEPWAEVGAQRILVPLPSEPLDALLPILDAAAALVPRARRMSAPPALPLPAPAEMDALYERLKNWGRWGDDELGALSLLTPERVAAAAALVTVGRAVSMAHDLSTSPGPDCPFPAQHHMLASGDARDANGIPGYEASRDDVGTEVHGLGLTHIDALCHMFVRGQMYNGRSADLVKSTGSFGNTIMALASGVSGRGVLLDVPAARGVPFLIPGDLVTVDDLRAAEDREGVVVGEGDLLAISTWRDARSAHEGARVNPFIGLAGLHPECLAWLHERGVALLGSDGISDPMPPLPIDQWPFPVHQIGIVGMGLHLIDNLRLDELASVCDDLGRWAFLLTVAPLRIPGGTGCPVNPIALF